MFEMVLKSINNGLNVVVSREKNSRLKKFMDVEYDKREMPSHGVNLDCSSENKE